MKPIRLIALDLDGTLLDSGKNLPARNFEALARCAEMGIHIVPATGRAANGVTDQVRAIPGVRYAITTNGGAILDLTTGETLERRAMDNEKALRLLRIADSYHTMYDPYIDGRGITQPSFYNHMDDYGLSPSLQDMVRLTRDVVPNILEYVAQNRKEVEKINIYLADLKDREILRAHLNREPGVVVTSSVVNNLEINSVAATKGQALLWLAAHLGICREATMAIGDGENDISMICEAGVGVAMGNALDQVKACADQITDNNDQAGVGTAVERLVLHPARNHSGSAINMTHTDIVY